MPGISDDELNKLFAEAGEAVKKVGKTDGSAAVAPKAVESASPLPSAPQPMAADDLMEPPPVPRATPPPFLAQAQAGAPAGATQIVGGEQTDAALVARAVNGNTVQMPWAQIRSLSLARVVDKQVLAFVHGGSTYYWSEENVTYKGLLREMQMTAAMNWRGLVNEISSHFQGSTDPGLQALTGAGGMVPKFNDLGQFLATVRSRA